jgi:hypothetical protein
METSYFNGMFNGMNKEGILRRVGNLSQLASIRHVEMLDGKAKGCGAFEVTTGGGLDFTVLEGKCLDIFSMKYKGINLSFHSKPGLTSSEYFNPHGHEFSRSFQAGMLFTCGLLNVGKGSDEDGLRQCSHGRIGHTPAEKVAVSEWWEEDRYVMEISGEMREAALFNENMLLKRTISTALGAKSLKIRDIVENQGFTEQTPTLLYHFNIGYPLLDEDAIFLIPAVKTLPRDIRSNEDDGKYNTFLPPADSCEEQVFFHESAGDAKGDTYVALVNEKIGLGLYIGYNRFQLPALVQWKSMKSGDYVLGIEPTNTILHSPFCKKYLGSENPVGPLETALFELEIGILEGENEINHFKRKVLLQEEEAGSKRLINHPTPAAYQGLSRFRGSGVRAEWRGIRRYPEWLPRRLQPVPQDLQL